MMRAILAALLLLAIVPLASAQTQASLVAGLEAQYRAAIVRERRLGDERELRLIAEAETRMRGARAALVSAQGDRAGAERELEAARAEYVRLVNEVELRDATLRVEVEAFRAEVENRLPEATRELLEAYREFADGDRVSAWTTLEPLLLARANARRAAARAIAAQEVGQLARLREVMRVNGEARIADVLALWTQMADLDPTRFYPQFQRASLALLLGDLPLAEAASALATANAQHDETIAMAGIVAAQVAIARGDTRTARGLREGSLDRARRYAAGASGLDSQRLLIAALHDVGVVAGIQGDFAIAAASHEEALSIARALPTTEIEERINLLTGLRAVARVQAAQGNLRQAEALLREALPIGQAMLEAEPNSINAKIAYAALCADTGDLAWRHGGAYAAAVFFDLGGQMLQRALDRDPSAGGVRSSLLALQGALGDAWMEIFDTENARENYEASLENARLLIAQEPQSVRYQEELARALDRRSDLAMREQQYPEARRLIENVVTIRRDLARRDPSSLGAQYQAILAEASLADALSHLDDVEGARAIWRRCVTDLGALRARAPQLVDIRRMTYTCMQRLAVYFPDGETTWPQLVAYMEEMERDGVLSEVDRGWLDHARQNAALLAARGSGQ
jgi:tetratricopeptide (TPR) repeat protein